MERRTYDLPPFRDRPEICESCRIQSRGLMYEALRGFLNFAEAKIPIRMYHPCVNTLSHRLSLYIPNERGIERTCTSQTPPSLNMLISINWPAAVRSFGEHGERKEE